ncbi:hypothetical protein BGX26_005254 [Mortierella sp. AD094]|nr:hypothetical protein BGX26_005254 [Mortierella sp. AD094]
MKYASALSALLVIATASVSTAIESSRNVTNCFSSFPMDLTTSTPGVLTPSTPCLGEEWCLTLTGDISNPILASATYNVVGKIPNAKQPGGIFYTDSGDLCTLLAAQGTPCPVPVTTTSIKVCRPIKSCFPTGVSLL